SIGGDLVVGASGTGTLIISNGGQVSNADAYIGDQAGSTGTVIVSGRDLAGNASTWTNGSMLYVGYGGAGTLLI
ncbi:hypothetical protein, partial [Escherichia coli]|uniref:hypothetical protein n=1 Tax=Escherichia coli TaxID=562 RepID=UPI0013D6EE0A